MCGGDDFVERKRAGHLPVPDLVQNLDESVLGANRTQRRHTSITAERNEVKMPAPVDPNQIVGHEVESAKTQTLRKSRRVCHSEKQTSVTVR
jgi:hypothetical protein